MMRKIVRRRLNPLPLLAPLPLLLSALLLSVSCGSLGVGGTKVTAGARLWASGPVRWLMLSEEVGRFRQLTTNRQALEFIEEFWRRRDPTPGEPENPLRASFFERASAADRLYAEGTTPGSLTDRGRALILLGHPPVLRSRRKAVPRLDPALGDKADRVWVRLTIWAYPRSELPPRMAEALHDPDLTEVSLTFVHDAERTYLLEGERYLKLAARSLVRPEALP